MEQFLQIGDVLGTIKALMVFKSEIKINQRQCCLLVDVLDLGFRVIGEEIKQNLRFEERLTRWKALEQPLKELHRVMKGGEFYIRQCLETKDWLVKAIYLAQNTDCIEFHVHNFLWCVSVVLESIEVASEVSGCDPLLISKKYEKEWMDPKLFQRKYGEQYVVSYDFCRRFESVWKEDRWVLLDLISEKRRLESGVPTKQEQRIAELLFQNLNVLEPSKGELFPSSVLVGSKDYQVKRRLGSGSHYKEIQWMGEPFAVRHFFAEIEPLIPEISLLSGLAHPNIMNFLCGFCDEDKKECFLLMELMNRDLSNYIKEISSPKKKIPFSLPAAIHIMLQIARGMEYLHSHKIYHGDLNPSNILVRTRNSPSETSFLIKVAGFGLKTIKYFTSRSTPNHPATNPYIWYAPEVLEEKEQGNNTNSKYTEKADVYSFGMICFELLTGKIPFEEGHLQGDKMSRNIRAGERPLFPFPSPKYLTNLIKKCWQADPIQRPGFSSICRILRYIKRFLVLNPDHSQPDYPTPLIDYCELDTCLSKSPVMWAGSENFSSVSQIPFQMFAYKVIERERTNVNLKEKSSESGSEGASNCGDENAIVAEESFSTPLPPSRASPEPNRRSSTKKSTGANANNSSGEKKKGRSSSRHPQLTPCGRSLRMNSESQIHPVVMSPNRRRTTGHASDSEI